jgi:hypothetical protein
MVRTQSQAGMHDAQLLLDHAARELHTMVSTYYNTCYTLYGECRNNTYTLQSLVNASDFFYGICERRRMLYCVHMKLPLCSFVCTHDAALILCNRMLYSIVLRAVYMLSNADWCVCSCCLLLL